MSIFSSLGTSIAVLGAALAAILSGIQRSCVQKMARSDQKRQEGGRVALTKRSPREGQKRSQRLQLPHSWSRQGKIEHHMSAQ